MADEAPFARTGINVDCNVYETILAKGLDNSPLAVSTWLELPSVPRDGNFLAIITTRKSGRLLQGS